MEKKIGCTNKDAQIQLNGKKRGIEICNANIEEKELIKLIKINDKYKKYFNDKTIIKTIYVKGRLINLILKWKN